MTVITAEPAPAVETSLPRRGIWRDLAFKAKVGSIILLIFLVVAIVGPLLAPYDPSAQNGPLLEGPSRLHLLGTTSTGQDVLSQLLVGVRMTVELGLVVGISATLLMTAVGVTSGYLGGFWDDLISFITNIFLVLPALPLLVVLLGYEKSQGQAAMIIVLSVLSWPWGARVIRAQTLTLRNRDYIAAAREVAMPRWRIILFEIVPNEVGLIAANLVNVVLYAIGTSVALTFLGLGSLSTWSLGSMLYWAQSQDALQLGAWWWLAPPGLAVALLGTALVLLNFGLDEYTNPMLRDVGRGRRGSRRPVDPTPVERADGQDGMKDHTVHLRRDPQTLGSASFSGSSAAKREGPVLEIDRLSIVYRSPSGDVPAVRDFSLTISAGEVVGLAGESGSGKSTLVYGACRLLRDPAVVSGSSVRYFGTRVAQEGVDLLSLDVRSLRVLRWREIAIVFQSAMNSLNPVLRIEDQIADVLKAHFKTDSATVRERAAELLELVRIPRGRLRSYPHELSGGMRQRVMIAIALAAGPELIIMDEPTTALDVVVQREILHQIVQLKDKFGFSILFITHDLSLLLELADRVAIMYAGRLVEIGSRDQIASAPLHPYTWGLLNSFPSLRGPRRILAGIPGSPPDVRNMPRGCSFQPRCGYARPACREIDMHLEWQAEGPDHGTACPFSLGENPRVIAGRGDAA